MTADIRAIGQQVRRIRRERAISQLHFALAIGVSESTVKRLEQGEAPFNPARLRGIAEVLGVTVEELLTGMGGPLG
jgi:transcriptional regulator with XRE-family HTH domain